MLAVFVGVEIEPRSSGPVSVPLVGFVWGAGSAASTSALYSPWCLKILALLGGRKPVGRGLSGIVILHRGLWLGYCAASATRDIPVTFSSTLLTRVIKGHARWRWRA